MMNGTLASLAAAASIRSAPWRKRLASPVGAMPGAAESVGLYRSGANSTMGASALLVQGSGQPHNNRQPYLAVTFIIALQGVFPQRA